uniref:Uncharacterized protein n=1 Tax=viral metagenome TaxID=1070528 RepID=A0A6H1ZMS6_9ZZZZ
MLSKAKEEFRCGSFRLHHELAFDEAIPSILFQLRFIPGKTYSEEQFDPNTKEHIWFQYYEGYSPKFEKARRGEPPLKYELKFLPSGEVSVERKK